MTRTNLADRLAVGAQALVQATTSTQEELFADCRVFVAAVERMRRAQQEYFRTRARQWLSESKAAEAAVDEMLAGREPRLF